MEDFNKIIESLNVRYLKSKNIRILQPVTISNFYDVENTLIYLNKGRLILGGDTVVKEGQIVFIPGGKSTQITYGSGNPRVMTHDDFISERDAYFESMGVGQLEKESGESYAYLTFEAKAFDSVNFFSSLDLPPFVIENDTEEMAHLIQLIFRESENDHPGKDRVISLNTDYLVVEIFRYIIGNQMFVEKLATNSTYFKDPRLIDIFTYIKENLNGDLSNKTLADVADVSEDYVGQYFKMLTGINPQDYIEYQRMEKAVSLLRTSKKSIRDIGQEVGYKDTAYFCRRFKMMFGIPAGKMRRRESLMNV